MPRKSVLVVDDSPDIHDLIDVRLRAEDVEVLHALDGAAALELARGHAPDLILLDLDLAGLSGLDLCRQLQADPACEATPIIFLTGNADVDTKIEALDAGAVDYVTKPFDPSELRARIRAALRGRQRLSPDSWRPPAGALEPEAAGPASGRFLGGRYVLEALLGSGSVGQVYRARDTRSGGMVAIKVLRSEHEATADVVSRLEREARAANLARHPNVVRVLEIGVDHRGAPFIVQELLRGETLAQRTARPPRLGVAEALALLLPIVEAVGAAHENGVIHRDLKPENVFLAVRSGAGAVIPTVLDFGLSRIHPTPEEMRLTQTGAIMGTPAYMSPEQITGEGGAGAASDVWSLGVILYEVLSGQRPFLGDTPWRLFQAIVHAEPPPLRALAPDVPEALERVIRRCLRHLPGERYQSAMELARELAAVA